MIRLTANSIAFILNKSPITVRHDLTKRKIYLNEANLIKKGAFVRTMEELIVYLAKELLKKSKRNDTKRPAVYAVKKRKGNKGSIGAFNGIEEE
jgi:hypothetical protein